MYHSSTKKRVPVAAIAGGAAGGAVLLGILAFLFYRRRKSISDAHLYGDEPRSSHRAIVGENDPEPDMACAPTLASGGNDSGSMVIKAGSTMQREERYDVVMTRAEDEGAKSAEGNGVMVRD